MNDKPKTRTPNGDHSVALWAGLTALFANLAAIELVGIIGQSGNRWAEAAASLLTAIIVAAGVYSKQRLDDAKKAREHGNTTPPQ
jgi:uncharacterized membrane protein